VRLEDARAAAAEIPENVLGVRMFGIMGVEPDSSITAARMHHSHPRGAAAVADARLGFQREGPRRQRRWWATYRGGGGGEEVSGGGQD
jgi:hypothetical protein